VSLIDRVREVLPPKYRELAKFLVVGGSAWVVDSGLFLVLSHTILNDRVITSKIISILVSTIFSYILNREWSFNNRGGRERSHEAMLFFVVNGIGLLLNLVPLWIAHYLLGFNQDNFAQVTVSISDFVSGSIIGTALGMAFRFWAYRRFVFPEELPQVTELVPTATPRGSDDDDENPRRLRSVS
jgi:putative flippase GtrA